MTTELKPFGGGGGTTITQETINNITQINNYLTEEVQNDITNVTNYYTEVNQSTGFVDPDASTISFNNGTRTFTIAPVGDLFTIWAFGTRYEKTEAESIQIDDVNGLWYIYYTALGVLGASQILWDLSTQVPVAMVLWDNGTGTVEPGQGNTKPSKLLEAYIMSVSLPGVMSDAQTCLFHVIAGSEKVDLNKSLPYSLIKCGTAPTAQTTFDILINNVSRGSAVIAAGQTSGTFTWNTKRTLNGGDVVKIVGPATADATLADVGITLVGVRK
jgi:hypothetical protein